MPQPQHNFRYCVITGNNPFMIKNVLRTRWWWSSIENLDENLTNINFLWTEYPNQKFSNLLEESQNKIINPSCFNQEYLEKRNKNNQKIKKFLNLNDGKMLDNINELNEKSVKLFKKNIRILDPNKSAIRIYNHIEFSYSLGDKKFLFHYLKEYFLRKNDDVFNYIPLTFHIKKGINDEEYLNFVNYFEKEKSLWIIKPGEGTNKGKGINITHDLSAIEEIFKNAKIGENGNKRTFIIQKYIEKPLLFYKRKFDIRCFFLLTSINGLIKGE